MRSSILTLLILCSIQGYSQVNLQNGVGSYDIPIFSYTEAKTGLSSEVSLSYSSGNGLKVGERPGNIGQNWSLNYGGAIFRKQKGEPDDQNSTIEFPVMPNGNIRGFNQIIAYYDVDYQSATVTGDPFSRNYIDNYYPNGFMYSEFAVDIVDPNVDFSASLLAPKELAILPRFQASMDKRYKLSRRSLTDREQDVFVYNFNGRTGEFVIGRDGNVQLLNDAKLVVQKTTADLTSQNIRTRINSFTIVDEKGIEYRFAAYELTEVLNPVETASEGTDAYSFKTMGGAPTGDYTIQKWLLTEIVNPAAAENINFLYENYNLDVIVSKTPTYQNTEGQVTETVQVFENKMKGQFKRIKTIGFPDGHQLDFSYQPGYTRPDVPDDIPLSQVKLKYNSAEQFSYNLGYGYFNGRFVRDLSVPANINDKRFARLCLTSVTKSANGLSEPPYTFTYYTGTGSSNPNDIVPPYDCLAQDHWGYYNQASVINIANTYVPKENIKDLLTNPIYREPFSGSASLGLLKSIEAPLGGTFTFEYEQNTAKDADNPTVSKIYGGVRVSKTIISDGLNTANDIVTNYYYRNADQTTSGWGYEAPTYLIEKEIEVWNAGNLDGYTNGGSMKTDMSAAIAKIALNQIRDNTAGAILTYFTKGPTAAYSQFTTAMTSMPQTILFSLIAQGMLKRLMILFNPSDYVQTNTYIFNSFQAQNPIGINYSRVEVVNSSVPGGVGKTVYEFSAPTNIRSEIPALVMPYSSKKRFPEWKYNLPTKTQIFNQAGMLISEKTNNYTIFSNVISNTNHKSCKVEVVSAESAACFPYNSTGNVLPLSDYSWEYYYPISGRAQLISTLENNYSGSGVLNQVSTIIDYNNDYQPKAVTSFNDISGDRTVIKTYYANDYNNISSAITAMKTKNMVNIPISTEKWLIKPNGTEYLVDATVNEFTLLWNSEVKLEKIYKLETKVPLLKSVIGYQDPAILVRNNTYFKLQQTYMYGSGTVLSETVTPAGRNTSFLYNFLNKVSVANVVNAHQNEIAYSSFETNETGNWTYLLANAISGNSVMGSKFYHFPVSSSITVSGQWSSAKEARVSFWKKGANPLVKINSSTLTPAKTVINAETGWTYMEYSFTGTGTVSITNPTGSGLDLDIDELRMYPKDGRMTTIGFNPMIGKTSECDVNNRILYYEYDALQRLIHIRDEYKNILKKICYNFSGQPENCIDALDVSPQWRDVGLTMCQPCEANPAYNSGIRLKQQSDDNPQSPTYQQTRWIVDPSGTCPSPPDWYQRTDLAYCGPFASYNIPTVDINPCSSTYLQWGTTIVIPNHPPCIACNPACTEPEYKCINGTCVQGTWGVVKVQKIDKFTWKCTSAYCFPDGTISSYSQTTTGSSPCGTVCP